MTKPHGIFSHIFTTRKVCKGYVFTPVCHSASLHAGIHTSGVDTPQSRCPRQTPHPLAADTHWQTPHPCADTPAEQTAPLPPSSACWQIRGTGNKRAVSILLECILVFFILFILKVCGSQALTRWASSGWASDGCWEWRDICYAGENPQDKVGLLWSEFVKIKHDYNARIILCNMKNEVCVWECVYCYLFCFTEISFWVWLPSTFYWMIYMTSWR